MPRLSSNDRYAYKFLALPLIYLLVVLLVPLVFSIVTSFFNWNLIGDTTHRFIGWKNYKKVFADEEMRNSCKVTAVFLVGTLSIELVFGYLLAAFLNIKFRGNHLVRVICLLPMMLSPTIIALMWKLILHTDRGILNYFLEKWFGENGPQVWLGEHWAMVTLILTDAWMNIPFVTLMVLAGMQAIPQEIYEASVVDGASYWQKTFKITIPLLKNVILIAMIFRTTFNLREFPLPWVLTAGGPANRTNIIGVELYREAFSYYHIGYASAFSWILLIVTFALSSFYTKMTLRKEDA